VYIGAILGAGFASGEEILQYFVIYEQKGIFAVLLSAFLFILMGWSVMDIVYKNNIKGYCEFTKLVFGDKLGVYIEFLSVIFMLILFAAMISAGGVMAEEVLNINSKAAVIVFVLICFITFNFNLKGIILINQIVSPLLIIGGVGLGLYTYFEKTIFVSTGSILKILSQKYILSAVVYVAYNIITAISVLATLGESIHSKKTAKYGAILGGGLLGIMGLSIALGIWANYYEVADLQLPMLKIAENYGNITEKLYILLMIMAMYTTAVLNGYEIIEWIDKKYNYNRHITIITVSIIAAILAQISFSDIVSKVYPLFAYVGGFEMLVVLFTALFI